MHQVSLCWRWKHASIHITACSSMPASRTALPSRLKHATSSLGHMKLVQAGSSRVWEPFAELPSQLPMCSESLALGWLLSSD